MAALSGMTGFARREGLLGAWSWSVEARSVNGRNLEVRFRGPPGFDSLERIAREAAQARFQRGQITVGLQAKRAGVGGKARIDLAELNRLTALAKTYVDSGLAAPPRFDGLLAVAGVIESGEDAEDADARKALEEAMAVSIAEAFDGLKAARNEEGAALSSVLAGLADRIEALRGEAEGHAAAQGPALKERYARRIAELVGQGATGLGAAGLDERIVQEAALLAVKADVREELDRLAAHVVSARALLAEGGPAGRRLDFLAQEFMREANTLCSKSASSALTATGLDLKAAIEQFREQIQNVE